MHASATDQRHCPYVYYLQIITVGIHFFFWGKLSFVRSEYGGTHLIISGGLITINVRKYNFFKFLSSVHPVMLSVNIIRRHFRCLGIDIIFQTRNFFWDTSPHPGVMPLIVVIIIIYYLNISSYRLRHYDHVFLVFN